MKNIRGSKGKDSIPGPVVYTFTAERQSQAENDWGRDFRPAFPYCKAFWFLNVRCCKIKFCGFAGLWLYIIQVKESQAKKMI